MRNTRYRLILILFFASGSAGLINQVVWSRLLQDVFGVTALAVTTVLATFLGGLALGAWYFGDRADKQGRPLRTYAWLELGIGLTTLLGLGVLVFGGSVHVALTSKLAPDGLTVLMLRLVFAALVVLPPTFLMGGTLPVMTRFLVSSLDQFGRKLGLLYALNTFGAVFGSMISGFVLIRLLGLSTTLLVAVSINLLIAAITFAIARGETDREPIEQATERSKSAAAKKHQSSQGSPWRIDIHWVLLASGFCALGLEVFWTRMLTPLVGSTTYAFVTMLMTFLTGIGLGSVLIRRHLDRDIDHRRWLALFQLGTALTVLLMLGVWRLMADGAASHWLDGYEQNWVGLLFARFGLVFLVMLPTTVLIGMAFPLAIKICTTQLASMGRSLGTAYGFNTFGNIMGAVCAGFLLLPMFGIQRGLLLLISIYLLNGVWLLWREGESRRSVRRWLLPITLLALVLPWFQLSPPGLEDEQWHVDYYREGLVGNVLVASDRSDPKMRWMSVDGVKIGQSVDGIDRKQQVLAHLPFLLLAEAPPTKVLTVGLGSGMVLGEMLKYPSVEQADGIELAGEVIEGAGLFKEFNGDALNQERARILQDDGVQFLRRLSETYDTIVSDAKSKTAHAGNSVFFSKEYYELCAEHLQENGMFIQWVPLEMSPSDLASALQSFRSAFPEPYVFVSPPDSAFLIGRHHPLMVNMSHMAEWLARDETQHIRRYGLFDAAGVLGLLMADGASLSEWLGESVPPNTLDHPILEFYGLADQSQPIRERKAMNLERLLEHRRPFLRSVELLGGDMARLQRDYATVGYMVKGFSMLNGQDDEARGEGLRMIQAAMQPEFGHGVARHEVARLWLNQADEMVVRGDAAGAISIYRRVLDWAPELHEVHHNLGVALQAIGRADEAVASFKTALQIEPQSAEIHFGLGNSYLNLGNLRAAKSAYQQALDLAPSHADAHLNLGFVFEKLDEPGEASRQYEAAIAVRPGNTKARLNLAELKILQKEWESAESLFRAVLAKEADNPRAKLGLVQALFGRKKYQKGRRIIEELAGTASDQPDGLRDLAAVLMTVEGVEELYPLARQYAEQAAEISQRGRFDILDILAEAYARTNDWEQAVLTQREAVAVATSTRRYGALKALRERLNRYESRLAERPSGP